MCKWLPYCLFSNTCIVCLIFFQVRSGIVNDSGWKKQSILVLIIMCVYASSDKSPFHYKVFLYWPIQRTGEVSVFSVVNCFWCTRCFSYVLKIDIFEMIWSYCCFLTKTGFFRRIHKTFSMHRSFFERYQAAHLRFFWEICLPRTFLLMCWCLKFFHVSFCVQAYMTLNHRSSYF